MSTRLRNGAPVETQSTIPQAELRLARLWGAWVTREHECCVCQSRGAVVPHRLISERALRRAARQRGVPEALLVWEAKLALPLCRSCAAKPHPIAREKVPAAAVEFAEQYGLVYVIDRIYPAREGGSPTP